MKQQSHLSHLSTSTPASEISLADFERNDSNGSAELDAVSLDDILKNSPAAALLGLKQNSDGSLPDGEEVVPTPEEGSDEDPDAESDAVNDTDDDRNNDTDEEDKDAEDDKSTQQAELPSEEDIDWDYKIPVQVDGKVEYKTLSEVRKGFATDQHLSQKGRELGELKKQVEQERTEKLNELVQLGTMLHEDLTNQEATLAQQYEDIVKKIEEARDSGDTFTARELKDKREAIQEQYWKLRTKREERTKQVVAQIQRKQSEAQQQLLQQFSKDIKEILPEFNEKVGMSIRAFALAEGIPEALLDSVYDARVVKFIDDYRRLKLATKVGSEKRKAQPTAKSVPTKKAVIPEKKKVAAAQAQRSRVLSGEATPDEELNFLKSLSTLSRKL